MFTLGGECDQMPSHFPAAIPPDQRDSAGKDDAPQRSFGGTHFDPSLWVGMLGLSFELALLPVL